MEIPSTMTEQVKNIEKLDISYRILHPSITIKDEASGNNIEIPFSSLTPKLLNVIAITKPKLSAAMVSIVWYPSIKPYKNGAVWYNSNGAFTDFSKLNIKHIKSTIIKISKLGVKTVPILLTNFPGFKHNQRTIKKNTVV